MPLPVAPGVSAVSSESEMPPFLRIHSEADLAALKKRLRGRMQAGEGEAGKTESNVREILSAVEQRGLQAVLEYTATFDAPGFSEAMFAVSPNILARAAASIPADDRAILRQAIERIRAFHERQQEQSWFIPQEDGSILGQMVTPLDRAGLYVPGGRAGETPLISSLIMNAVPALAAGVREIAVISPPRRDGSLNPYILAAAHELDIREVYAAGSAWGIAALAFGAGPLKPVDIIAGPGNIWVTTAKRLLLGRVGIDMLAGPSEICIIADASANPAWLAADMLSQAEHDPMASAICIVPTESMARNVAAAVKNQLADLPRAEIAAASLRNWGGLIIADGQTPGIAAADIANALAPEHLELCVAAPWDMLPAIRHAGAIFLGHHAAESAGDYFAGPNHVLPTMSTARFSSALGVQNFCKKTSILAMSPAFAAANAPAIARMARLEGLEGHARSMEKRLEQQTAIRNC